MTVDDVDFKDWQIAAEKGVNSFSRESGGPGADAKYLMIRREKNPGDLPAY
ncbi:MAG: hypothetical protein H0A75_06510 [Candidatus Methanofishera endochildressiae]|uniref:Uncharacterized protein n=1 Tax=Candidatus Methanofishera endochildressiae TaxID=2738884 RepID=A0A7Z0MPR5_9GAMM|nr:hypothetical protein [Candidatus Methanofishera endochildressiae]